MQVAEFNKIFPILVSGCNLIRVFYSLFYSLQLKIFVTLNVFYQKRDNYKEIIASYVLF